MTSIVDLQKSVYARVEKLPDGLREHVLRARDIALELARRHALDAPRVELAITAHDLFRAAPGKALLPEARSMGIPVTPVDEAAPVLLHGPVAAQTLRREGLDDREVYEAVYWHSTGHPGLGPLGMAVFLADKLDPGKAYRYSYLAELKALALESLERATLDFLEREMIVMLQQGKLIHVASLDTRNALLLQLRPPSSPGVWLPQPPG